MHGSIRGLAGSSLLVVGLAMLGLSVSTGVGGCPQPVGTGGIDFALPPAGTHFSLAVNNNAGDMQFGSFVNYLSFDTADSSVSSSIPQVVSVSTTSPPEIDGTEAPGEWSGSATTIALSQITTFAKYDGINPPGVSSVSVRSMYDDLHIYFLLSWADATESFEKDKLAFDATAGTWSKSGNEDRFYFHFPITGFSGTEFADRGGCATFCHYDETAPNGKGYMFTGASDELVDTWQWKASRSNPVGFIHDKHLIYQPSPASGRKGDQGLNSYLENKIQGSGFPHYMHVTDPNANAAYPSFEWEMAPFDTTAVFADGATIPGVFLRNPIGSNADVFAYGSYTGSGWVVEVMRARNTGNGDDHQFLP